jgi:UDP-glucose:tetrahydrobiopterin glucosyltransferase
VYKRQDNVPELASSISKIAQLDRLACRQQAATEYSLSALGDRFEAWFKHILEQQQQPNKLFI